MATKVTDFPNTPAHHATERHGINAVALACARLSLIWRETTMGDVGIDGQIEYVDAAGNATGRMVAVQVKAGPTYFRSESKEGWIFQPAKKHRLYWERFPMPVLLILHNPDTGFSFWTDARQALRNPNLPPDAPLLVRRTSILEDANRDAFFTNTGVSESPYIDDLTAILNELVSRKSQKAGFPISYFDLFTNGLTNITRSIYYGMDLAFIIAEANIGFGGSKSGITFGDEEQNFLFNFVRFLVGQHLADIDFADCLIDWNDRQMQPTFMAPLTSRGRALNELISDAEMRLVREGLIADWDGGRVVRERFVRMEFSPDDYLRMARIHELQELIEPSQD